jgi:hypothetical protein
VNHYNKSHRENFSAVCSNTSVLKKVNFVETYLLYSRVKQKVDNGDGKYKN